MNARRPTSSVRIVGAKVLEFSRRLDGSAWNPAFRWHVRRAPLLVLETDRSIRGVGEAWSRQPQIDLVLDALSRHYAPALLGADLREAASVLARIAPPSSVEPWAAAAAASAADVALWDLRAQAAGEPLWRTLGGSRDRAAAYASGGLYRDHSTLRDLEREFERYVTLGFTAVKMKIGALPLEDDLARVRAVRRAIGAETTLWVDAVNQLDRDIASAWCDALARAGVAAIQAPLPFDDVAGMAQINAARLPVVATEAEHRESAFRALVDAHAVTYVQYCVGLCGGFTGAARVERYAASRNVRGTAQCFSTSVLQAASLHFGAACDNVATVEYHRFHDHLAALLPDAMRRVDSGIVHLGDAPGLGVAPPPPGEQPDGGHVRVHRALTLDESSLA